jgi:hypothetical protein
MNNRTRTSKKWLIIFSITVLYTLSSFTVEGKTFAVVELPQDTIYFREVVDKLPEFPGGQSAMEEFKLETLRLSRDTVNENWQVNVYVWFTVRKTGEITDISLGGGVHDKEAIRVLESMPNWIPAEYKGEKVNVEYSLDIQFNTQIPEDERDYRFELISTRRIEPEFPGGLSALRRFLTERIQTKFPSVKLPSPLTTRTNFPSGCVLVGFIIERDGSVRDIELVQNLDPYLDEIVLQAVETMPRWTPGQRRNQPIMTKSVISFEFQFAESERLDNNPIILINTELDTESELELNPNVRFFIR